MKKNPLQLKKGLFYGHDSTLFALGKNMKTILLMTMMLLSVSWVQANTNTAKISGNWSSPANWSRSCSGTISVPKSSTTVTGTGTSFTTDCVAGAIMTDVYGSVIGTIASVTSNTSLELTTTAKQAISGLSIFLQRIPQDGDDVIIDVSKKFTLDITSPDLGSFSLNDGEFVCGANTLKVGGNFVIATGTTFTAGTGIVNLNGTVNQIITTNGKLLNNLIISNTVGVCSTSTGLTASTVTINPGSKFTNNGSLTATTLNIQSGANGTGTYLGTGTLNISGTSTVQQYLSVARNWYMSTPVNTGKMPTAGFKYNETVATNYWEAAASGATMTDGRGYILIPSTPGTVSFSGALNNGAKSIALTSTSTAYRPGYNLVGNPYPSHITWTEAMATAANTLTTIWYRTFNSGYAFQTYNAAVGIGVPFGTTGLISPMQAFWVKVNAGGGTLNFNNAIRSHSTSANPLKAPAATSSDLKLLRLEVTNGIHTDETVILSHVNAMDAFDNYDSPKMINGTTSSVPDIYTRIGAELLAINGMNTIPYDTEIPLYFAANASVGSTFSITAKQFSNFEEGTQVFIKNNLTGTSQFISDGSGYSFDLNETGTNPKLSIIIKAPGAATQLENTGKSNIVVFANANHQINVTCNDAISADATVSVYNNLGQRIARNALTENGTLIDNPMTSGVYMVTVINAGNKTTEKIILR